MIEKHHKLLRESHMLVFGKARGVLGESSHLTKREFPEGLIVLTQKEIEDLP